MPSLQPLRAEHADAVLAFELANRAYFAASISDRGDEFFAEFTDRFAALLADNEAGTGASYLLLAGDGSVLGRFNLIFTGPGTANLGYRMAEQAAGQGLATSAVRELCALALDRHGLRILRAATSHQNLASQRVLAKTGFLRTGPADPAEIGGKQGSWHQRNLGFGQLTLRFLREADSCVRERLLDAADRRTSGAEYRTFTVFNVNLDFDTGIATIEDELDADSTESVPLQDLLSALRSAR